MQKGFFLSILILLILSGCTTTYQITLKQDFKLKDGRIVLQSMLPHSTIRLEIASLIYKDSVPFVVAIYAKINTPCKHTSCIFSMENISLYSNSFNPSIIPAKLILNSSLNFTDTLQNFSIPTPIFYPPKGPDFFYSPLFPFGGLLLINSRQDDIYFRESDFSRRILFSRYLKPSHLDSENFVGGFVAFNLLRSDKKDGDLIIYIRVNSELHNFDLHFSKKH